MSAGEYCGHFGVVLDREYVMKMHARLAFGLCALVIGAQTVMAQQSMLGKPQCHVIRKDGCWFYKVGMPQTSPTLEDCRSLISEFGSEEFGYSSVACEMPGLVYVGETMPAELQLDDEQRHLYFPQTNCGWR